MNIFAALALFLALAGPGVSQVVNICPGICNANPDGYVQAREECNQPNLLNLCRVEKCLIDGAPGFTCTTPQNSVIVSNTVFDTNSVDLRVDYSWGEDQTDLESATTFLADVSGRDIVCGFPGPFMTFSGDDTGFGGREYTIVDIELARQQSFWTDFTSIGARANWFGETNQGPATLTAYLRDRATDSPIPGTELSMEINPGTGTACADTPVGFVFVTRGLQDTRITLSTGQ